MSYCKKYGKDVIVFATKEDHQVPSSIQLPEIKRPDGVIRADGSINWGCPCLGNTPAGPCGLEFREAFSCFHYSKADPRGSDCLGSFSAMQECMHKYPTLYGDAKLDAEFNEDDDAKHSQNNKISTKA